MIAQEKLDYRLPDDILAVVKGDLFEFKETLKKSREVVDYAEDYSLYPTMSYGDVISYTMPPSNRKTDYIADDVSRRRIEISAAKNKVKGIREGIRRAAYTAQPKKRVKLNEDLEDYLLNKMPNQSSLKDKAKIGRDPRTLRTYTERAYYFIAVELGYISIDKDIQLAENQINRKIIHE